MPKKIIAILHAKSLFILSVCMFVYIHMGLNATKPVLGVSHKRDSNQAPKQQRLARKLRFCL